MAWTRATLLTGNRIIAESMKMWIEMSSKSWGGWFTSPDPRIDPGDYSIELDDGRKGNIVISNVSADSNQKTIANFIGNGPLA